MVFITKNALGDDLINEVDQKRYSLLFVRLDGNAPFSVYMCKLPGGENATLNKHVGNLLRGSFFLID